MDDAARVDDVASTLGQAIACWADLAPDRIAIRSPGRPPCTYADLDVLARGLPGAMRRHGVGAGIVAATGTSVDLAIVVATLGCGRPVAPLGPGVDGPVVPPGMEPVGVVAVSGEVPAVGNGPVIAWADLVDGTHPARDANPSGLDDAVFVVATSGSTGRPKLVPNTNANLAASAQIARDRLDVGPDDVCLCLAPLHHVMGLRALSDVIFTGGTMVVPDGVDFASLGAALACRPTFLLGPPPQLRALLAAVESSAVDAAGVRFVRSASAPMAPSLRGRLGEVFGPVVVGYGLSEVAKVASDAYPSRGLPDGCVGPAAVEVRITDPTGRDVEAGAWGEVVVRGPTVFPGYLGDPVATAAAFRDGWFRTGDRGRVDRTGVWLEGRLDDVVNRGGTMVVPRVLERHILAHPDVDDVAVVAVDHPVLGRDLVATVVRSRPGDDIRTWLAHRVPPDQLPGRIDVRASLPRTSSGKVARAVLASEYAEASPGRTARGEAEPLLRVRAIWSELLDRPVDADPAADWFASGGDSLLAVELVERLGPLVGRPVTLRELVGARTLGAQAALVADGPVRPAAGQVVPLAASGRPVFVCPGAGGTALAYVDLQDRLPAAALHVVEARALHRGWWTDIRVERAARRALAAVLAVQPVGPYHLVGRSFGGYVALEVARNLHAAGERLGAVVLVDTFLPGTREPVRPIRAAAAEMARSERGAALARRFARGVRGRAVAWVRRHPTGVVARRGPARYVGFERIAAAMSDRYRPAPFGFPIVVLATADARSVEGWVDLAPDTEVRATAGTHSTMLVPPAVDDLAANLAALLDRADA